MLTACCLGRAPPGRLRKSIAVGWLPAMKTAFEKSVLFAVPLGGGLSPTTAGHAGRRGPSGFHPSRLRAPLACQPLPPSLVH